MNKFDFARWSGPRKEDDTPEEPKAAFTLVVGDDDGSITNADVPVRWCITKQLLRQLDDRGVRDPHILLITREHEGWVEYHREVVPISQLKTFVRFRRAGEQVINAWIIDGRCGRESMNKVLLRRTNGQYDTDMIEHDYNHSMRPSLMLEDDVDRSLYEAICATTAASVDVPKTAFARKPPKWISWYVNLWHSSDKLEDSCHFRRRAMIAVPKLIPFLTWAVSLLFIRVLAGLCMTGIGYRQMVDWSKVFRLFKYPSTSKDNIYMKGSSFARNNARNSFYLSYPSFSRRSSGCLNERGERVSYPASTPILASIAWNPLTIGITMLIVVIIGTGAEADHEDVRAVMLFLPLVSIMITAAIDVIVFAADFIWAKLLRPNSSLRTIARKYFNVVDDYVTKKGKGPQVFLGGMVGVTALITVVVVVFWELFAYLLTFAATVALVSWGLIKLINTAYERWAPVDQFNTIDEIEQLLCPNDMDNITTDISSIPVKQRTWRLKYKETKNKVCKPMQML